ncbi:MAG TPA: 23S rRNA (guanosine(2251)-2'-O)-methyltransferase RlmB [Polyangiaceae bacterium]|nr:23S rRNA (guanosine(2251)-2'-O)-methyltransferase RlmB [Polyangiaceae bacterium]
MTERPKHPKRPGRPKYPKRPERRPEAPPDPHAPRLVLGLQPVREAIRVHGERLGRVLVESKPSPRLDALARFAADRGASVERASRSQLDRLAQGTRHQGAAAWAPELPVAGVEALEIGDDTLLVVLDGITDPHNFGATLRCAVALGATGVLWGEHHAAPLTPATFRASAGAVEHARLHQVPSLHGALERLGAQGVATVALDASADTLLSEVPLTGPAAVVIGAEDTGVARAVRRACQHRAKLPMTGPLDSLNASVAAGMALYEVVRQRDD